MINERLPLRSYFEKKTLVQIRGSPQENGNFFIRILIKQAFLLDIGHRAMDIGPIRCNLNPPIAAYFVISCVQQAQRLRDVLLTTGRDWLAPKVIANHVECYITVVLAERKRNSCAMSCQQLDDWLALKIIANHVRVLHNCCAC